LKARAAVWGRVRAALLGVALLVAGTGCEWGVLLAPDDLMLHLDPTEHGTLRVKAMLPGAPWIGPGPDGEYGTADDEIRPAETGDVDLVLRSGMTDFSGPFPKSHAADVAPRLTVGGPGHAPVAHFVVGASDGAAVPPEGNPVVTPSLEHIPMIIMGFADLDGDGFIGITQLDGDDSDSRVECAELETVALRMAIFSEGRASGDIRLPIGGPEGAEATIVLAAGAYTGKLSPDYLAGVAPSGPVVATKLPMFPYLDPYSVIDYDFPPGPLPAHPDRPAAIWIGAALEPDPEDKRFGERFTIRTDGSEVTVDLVSVRSGPRVRFGVARVPDGAGYRARLGHAIRPGLDDAGLPVPYEILSRMVLPDDGTSTQSEVRILALDGFGNVADLEEGVEVSVQTTGGALIVSPDSDGDPHRESIWVADSRGASVLLDDSGGVYDDPDAAQLIVSGPGGLSAVDLRLPDPDVDDSGVVDEDDLDRVERGGGDAGDGEEFDEKLDVNGDGFIDGEDEALVEAFLGAVLPTP